MTSPKSGLGAASRFLSTDEPGSEELADLLRSGPVRATLDKLMRAAAEAVGVDYMVLGLRHHDAYEFVATYGVPLTGYRDRVPTDRMSPKLFDREVEVPDLQKEPNFVVLDIVSEARSWHYGVNAPVRPIRPLADGGVLALSGASRQFIKPGGAALAQIRRFADIIADLVWLTVQIRNPRAYGQMTDLVGRVLTDSIKSSPFAAAIIDKNLDSIGFSHRFLLEQRARAGSSPIPGTSIVNPWLDEASAALVTAAFESGKPLLAQPVTGADGEALQFDFHRLSYDDVPFAFGLIGFYRRRRGNGVADRKRETTQAEVAEGIGDGTGPVSKFLLATLPARQRLLKRGQQSYIGLRTWRKTIKEHQLSALKALKSDPPDAFVEVMATEIADAVRATYGKVDHACVVAVPCGHSGPQCLSARLASQVAKALSIPCVIAFDFQPVRGSSHPKANVRRPSMRRLPVEFTGPVILVDDVATSGSHIREAAKLLADANAVWPIAWIAD